MNLAMLTGSPLRKASMLALLVALTLVTIKPAPAQTLTVLHSFAGPDGQEPYAGLARPRRQPLRHDAIGRKPERRLLWELRRRVSAHSQRVELGICAALLLRGWHGRI